MAAGRRRKILFISYTSKDRAEAADLHAALLDAGYEAKQIFLDSDEDSGIDAGNKWEQVLYERLKECQALLVLCSTNWRQSRWCFAELVYAKMSGKEIFPVLIDDVDIGDVASEHQAVFPKRDGSQAYKRLLGALDSRHLGPRDHLPWPHPDLKDESGNIDNCPFPGLFAFDERYAGVYFGREPEIKTVLEQLNEMRRKGEPRLLMIVGGSGSGKSSVLRAGVLPRLKHKSADSDWLVLPILRYADLPSGENAFFDALAENIINEYRGGFPGAPDHKDLRAQLRNPDQRQAAENAWEAIHDLAIARGVKDSAAILPVDQFEELLTPTAGAMAANFLAFLKAICERPNPRFFIVGTMRSDYLDLYERHPHALKAPLFLPWRLEPFPRERLVDVIVNPARRAHVKVDDDLLEVLKQDTPTSDALPLLAFTLRDLYKRCAADGQLQLSEYRNQGGMEGSIRTSVEKIIPRNSLSQDVKAALRLSFLTQLAQVNEKDEFIRRKANWSDIDEAARPILSRFVSERLLVRSEQGGEVQIEVAHEAMLRCWDELNDWLRTSAGILRWRRDVHRDQESDRKNKRRWSGLRPAQLAVAREWPSDRRNELTHAETQWIEQGIRRLHLRFVGIVAVLLMFASLAGFALLQTRNANESERVAISSLETQLKMFTEATRLAGTIAAAVTNGNRAEVEKAFADLSNEDIPLVRTPSIEESIRNLKAEIDAWIPEETQSWKDEATNNRVRQAALRVADAVRDVWKKQMLPSRAKLMTRDLIVRPVCNRAVAVTAKLAKGQPGPADITELEKLYWGELVFFEPPQVALAMVTFRGKLLGGENLETADLKAAAAELKAACDSAANETDSAEKE